MRLQIEMKNRPHISRLNRLVFGVAILWLVTSVLLLMLSAGSHGSHYDNNYEHKLDRTRKNAHQQLYARAEHQATARASFIS